MLAEIDGIHDDAGVQKMIIALQSLSVPVPFGLGASPTITILRMVIADVAAAGLGLPDRDYYLKTGAALQGSARRNIWCMWPTCSNSPDTAMPLRTKAAAQVMQFETALAKATLDNVARAIPQATRPQDQL